MLGPRGHVGRGHVQARLRSKSARSAGPLSLRFRRLRQNRRGSDPNPASNGSPFGDPIPRGPILWNQEVGRSSVGLAHVAHGPRPTWPQDHKPKPDLGTRQRVSDPTIRGRSPNVFPCGKAVPFMWRGPRGPSGVFRAISGRYTAHVATWSQAHVATWSQAHVARPTWPRDHVSRAAGHAEDRPREPNTRPGRG